MDTTYQDLGSVVSGNGAYILNSSREPSSKPSHIQTNLNIVQGAAATGIAKGNPQGRQRILQPGVSNNSSGQVAASGGSLTSRFPQGGHHPEAGVFSYHDQSTYSSTIEDESRMMKT